MKTNSCTILRAAIAAVLLCGMVLCASACRETPTAVIDPVDDTNVTTTTRATRATVAVPEGQMTIADLMVLRDETMVWSDLEPFTHEMTGEDTARFMVADTFGKEATLDVTIDYDSGYLTAAVLSYGDVVESVMVSSNACLMRILHAMDGEAAE